MNIWLVTQSSFYLCCDLSNQYLTGITNLVKSGDIFNQLISIKGIMFWTVITHTITLSLQKGTNVWSDQNEDQFCVYLASVHNHIVCRQTHTHTHTHTFLSGKGHYTPNPSCACYCTSTLSHLLGLCPYLVTSLTKYLDWYNSLGISWWPF